jgi:DNA modification methylase
MTKARITIETTAVEKAALNSALRGAGLTLPEWFGSQVDGLKVAIGAPCIGRPEELRCLNELSEPSRVMEMLSTVDWSFSSDDTSYLSHDIHPYPAKFIPQIPRNLIARLSLRGELVYDPFGGCGTTALEAILLGRQALSTDVHPLAKIIGEAKTLTLTKEEEEQTSDIAERLMILSWQRSNLRSELEIHKGSYVGYVPDIPNISEWFHANAVDELAYLRWTIENQPSRKVRTLLKAAFSKSVLKSSFQDAETRYARRPREVDEGFVVRLFAVNLQAALKKIQILGPMLRFREATFETIDLRTVPVTSQGDWGLGGLKRDSVDLIVTSPPYPNTTDYHLYHRFRLFWLGYDPRMLAAAEIGSHLRHQKEGTGFEHYLQEMRTCVDKIFQVLRPGRYAIMVLGDGVFGGQLYKTPQEIARVAVDRGFEKLGTISRPVHATKRSFIPPARRIRCEELLVLRRPIEHLIVDLVKPQYKLWPYEEDLRLRELTQLCGVHQVEQGSSHSPVPVNCLSIDRLRRLTFTHAFRADKYAQEPTWQAILENGNGSASRTQRKDPKYATHGIHAYKGKFYPQLAKCLFNLAQLEPGQAVIDPFCGSGTVLLEAYLNGLTGVGIDLNPLAVKIARVKTEVLELDPYVRDRHLAQFKKRLYSAQESDDSLRVFSDKIIGELLSWFPKPVLTKLGWLLQQIRQVPDPQIRDFLEVILSSLVRTVSNQEPRDLRIRRREPPISDAPVYELFSARLGELRVRLQQFAERSKLAPNIFYPARAIHGDSREMQSLTNNGVQRHSFDAVITSPPYATALPYIDTDRLSILLLFGMASKDRSTIESSLIGTREINKRKREQIDELIDLGDFTGIRSSLACTMISLVRTLNRDSDGGFRKQNTASLLYLYFRDMSAAFRNINWMLRKGGQAFFVIGDNKTTAGGKEVHIESGRALQEIGLSLGWELVDRVPITVTTENRLHVKNSITENSILWFKK